MRKGDAIELSVHRRFQCLLGASSKEDGPISSPLSEVPSPPERLSSKEVWHFSFLINGAMEEGRGLRVEEREKTDIDEDRDRTGNNGSHRERK